MARFKIGDLVEAERDREQAQAIGFAVGIVIQVIQGGAVVRWMPARTHKYESGSTLRPIPKEALPLLELKWGSLGVLEETK